MAKGAMSENQGKTRYHTPNVSIWMMAEYISKASGTGIVALAWTGPNVDILPLTSISTKK